jgi:tripartite-type tricarboxylate transporter receptor subunit TctC
LYNVAPKDGTTFAHFGRNMILLGALKNNKNVMFEPDKLTWLGSSSSFRDDAYILIVREDSPFKTIADATRADGPRLIIGGSAEGSTSNDVPVILGDTIGLRYQLVKGYPDSAALFLALEKGEIQARMVDLSGVRTIKPAWLKPGGGYRVLVQFGRETRNPDLADAPTARELAISDSARTLITLSELPYKFSRPFAAPPGLPPERAAILQKAFMAAHSDPTFVEEATRLGLDISPVGPDAVAESIREIERAPNDVLDYLRKLFSADKT